MTGTKVKPRTWSSPANAFLANVHGYYKPSHLVAHSVVFPDLAISRCQNTEFPTFLFLFIPAFVMTLRSKSGRISVVAWRFRSAFGRSKSLSFLSSIQNGVFNVKTGLELLSLVKRNSVP
jgi:hypothetical protein